MATKEKYNFRQKFNLALALLAVFFLILATNLVDRRHFETAQEALTSVYEDRVVAQHYIFEISTIVYQKEQQFIENNTNKWSVENDARIEELIEQFAGTKLTTSERRQFESLKEHLTTLERIETKYRENSINNKTHVIPEIFKHIKNDLNDLAETQILESKSKMFLAQKSLNTTNLLSNLELGLLIIVGIAIQFVIFYRIKKTSYGSNLKTVN
ncbi:MCP four helix bundle domain-containing protein [Croceibacter atlanticus]|jgi:phosphatidylglycerophosphatase A|uniref:MCP four helix bundle domain-containing protein n=1 Tax=Croceibacter atlanticus TaxID=313588 RepID=UPI0024B9C4F3|nr:MCP four helix bundle domain-containing protein [Croceibacter atlanticus]|tara:strand:+ start:370 stop:1008 length:639 start_codon:yes stop_codon:yes gene_type:complete